MGLFRAIESQDEPLAGRPLADRMRPQTLDEFMGQEDLLGPGKPLRIQIERDDLSSMLFWGPPGCGKTTLARIIARRTKSEYIPFSAVLAGIKEIKEVMAKAEGVRHYGRRTIVFRGRDAPLQSRAAGRVSSPRRSRQHPSDRRNH